jgi:hypothetical protein
MNHILLIARDDATDLRDRIVALLSAEDAHLDAAPVAFPDPASATVVLVVLSPRALAEAAVVTFLGEADRRQLPIVPIVEELATYDFDSVSLPELNRRNAVAWNPGDGEGIVRATRGHLGFEAFPRKKKVFISYRRQDGEAIARRIHRYLRRHEYKPFLDVLGIEGGAPVQSRIMEEISDKDFILLIDTPLARMSGWVQAEIVEALNQRIPVRVLAVGMDDPYPLLLDVERLPWNGGDRRMMARLRDFVSRGIASTTSFDVRCHRVLAGAAEARGLRLAARGRQVVLSGDGRRALIEYERALPSIERLHRLYQSYRTQGRGPAVLISGDQPIPHPTGAAIVWARGRAPLAVVSLHDVPSLLDVLFG